MRENVAPVHGVKSPGNDGLSVDPISLKACRVPITTEKPNVPLGNHEFGLDDPDKGKAVPPLTIPV